MSHEKPSFVFSSDVISDKDYVAWIAEVKQRFGSFQAKAAVRVNQAMLELYWSLGQTWWPCEPIANGGVASFRN